ncbi:MAG: EamA family transporter, partial [Firmicutes bacterium]|nr:EamA family transporter [Bacillota bacterium]
ALGTFFDAYYLDDVDATPLLGVTEEKFESAANNAYEYTFLIVGILLLIWLVCVKKERLVLKRQGNRLTAAVLETAGQAAYVYAMSGQGVVAAPMIASYSIVSLILSRIFLKEKLTGKRYLMVAAVLAGIALLGLAEGLAE